MEPERGIRYFPIALFTSVMGLSGATMAVKHAEKLYGWNHVGSTSLLLLTTLLFLLNGMILIYRLARYPGEVKRDFNHPVRMNFFGAISISLLLLAKPYLDISTNVSFALWALGALLQISLTLAILSRLIRHHSFQIGQFNPAWFIPIVGNIIVPIAGSSHASLDINWMFFSIGVLFSIIYMTIFFNRIFFHPPLPEPLLPTFFILMAPPAIGFVSYLHLVKRIDVFATMLYGTAFFIGLLLIIQLIRFIRIPFFISWWAFLFPSAAMTIATAHMYTENGNQFYKWLFTLQVVGLIILSIYLLGKTIALVLNRKLCLKES